MWLIKKLFQAMAVLFVVCLLVGLFQAPGITTNIPQKQSPVAEAESSRIFEHGFRVGYAMAKGGAIKPKGDEVDAMARRAAGTLGHGGGLGFKMQWTGGFWEGWRQGD